MTDNTPTFNIFGAPTKDDIRVGYISTDTGLVEGITVCEANDYAKLNPKSIFIFRDRTEIRYIDINQVNQLEVKDLIIGINTCDGIKIDAECTGPEINFFGGGGLGAKANPIIGKDGSLLAVDVVEGGFGYKTPPLAEIKDPCGIGAGALVRSVLNEGDEGETLIEYDDEDDFEEYEICPPTDTDGFGSFYDVRGKNIGEWNPALYLDDSEVPFNVELEKYLSFLRRENVPWWTTRIEPPLRVTSDGKISRAKYDVDHWAWGSTPVADGKYDESVDVAKGNIVNNKAWLGGNLYEVDKVNSFMNKYAISPLPMSNVKGSDKAGKEHYFEWEVEFPHSGEYKFRFQCDNRGKLYIDNKLEGEYELGSGGAAGDVLSPPVQTIVGITTGFHRVRVDVYNNPIMKKVAKEQPLDEFPTSNQVDFKITTATLYGATASIEGLDISIEKKYGEDNNVTESFNKDVEFGRIYDVKITSNNIKGNNTSSSKLRTQGEKVLQMEDYTDESYDDVVISVNQGRFFDINGLNCKYTLGQPPVDNSTSSTESSNNLRSVFNTVDYIDKANRQLWRTNTLPSSQEFVNQYGVSPFDTSTVLEDNPYAGTHEIKWHNVTFPVSGEYDISIGVDDNVRLIIGNDVNIYKQGFVSGTNNPTGSSKYRRFITAGTYTIIADLEQIPGGKFGYTGQGINPMVLAIDIETSYVLEDEKQLKSWNENPLGVAVSIEAPEPPIPQEPLPVQEGRCPPNPFWSTRFPNAATPWYPFPDNRKVYRYAMSPVPPYDDEDTSGGGNSYENTWTINAPYSGFYKLKASADDSAVIKIDGIEVLSTVGVTSLTTEMVQILEGEHEISVEVTNQLIETHDFIDQRVFSTQSWGTSGTEVVGIATHSIKSIVYVGLHESNKPINVSSDGKRIELKDGDGTDANATFSIVSGDAKFSSDGRRIEGNGSVTVVLTWNDRERSAGVAIENISIEGTKWTRKGRSGTESHDIIISSESVNITGGLVGGTSKDGVVYNGPELFHLPHSAWGKFMNKASVSPNYTRENATNEVLSYTWKNVDFPEDGNYSVKFQMDHSATLFIDDRQVATNTFIGQGIDGRHSIDFSGDGKFKQVQVNKGKHTISVRPTVYTEASGGPIGFKDALFKQPAGYVRDENPSGFAIEILVKKKIARKNEEGEVKTQKWTVNPVAVSAHLIPPPCPKRVRGKGVVKEVIPIDPGNGFGVPDAGPGISTYPVVIELANVIPEDGGINYSPDDEVIIDDKRIKPKLGPFGEIIEIDVPSIFVTEWPDISVDTSTGIGFVGLPVLRPRRDPIGVDPDKLIQVTDLVGVKQTGYYEGRSYYGSVFYKDGIKYAGWYETAGQLIQIYDTLQESIDAQVTTPPSAIQRQGSDVSSNNPRLNIPGTPDNLTY